MSARVLAAVLVALLVVPFPLAAKGKKKRKEGLADRPSAETLFNAFLGIDYSHWLVGPVYHLASEQEVADYLALTTDEQARAFIEGFWARRNADTPVFQDTPQEIFAARTQEADKRFSEAAFPGSRTDRGTVWILYGEPASITAEVPERVADPAAELWTYAEDAPLGLDGRSPGHEYRFVKDGDLTVLMDEGLRRRLQARNRFERSRDGG